METIIVVSIVLCTIGILIILNPFRKKPDYDTRNRRIREARRLRRWWW